MKDNILKRNHSKVTTTNLTETEAEEEEDPMHLIE
jgi:hypothetical protein